MPDEKWIWTLERTIPSDPDLCAEIISEVLAALESNGWPERDSFAIHMALEEAIQNAIRHGNGCHPEKTVEIDFRLTDETLVAKIVDQGCGFDRSAVPDPTLDSNLESCSGRGLMLIEKFVDVVTYNEVGNSVELIKKKSPSE